MSYSTIRWIYFWEQTRYCETPINLLVLIIQKIINITVGEVRFQELQYFDS